MQFYRLRIDRVALAETLLGVLSVGCELVSAGRSAAWEGQISGHEALPLGQRDRAAKLESLAVDEVAFGIEMIVQGGMDRGEFL